MDRFEITGQIVVGARRFRKEIALPVDLLIGHEAWMDSFVQGTLNVQFPTSTLPEAFHASGLRALDLNSSFQPAIYRSGASVSNNTIQPSAQNPSRGDLQLWKALLENHDTQNEHRCFLIRRVESGYRNIVEILGQHHFRSEFGFSTGNRISITIFAKAGET